eukprot:4520098-Pyramimonas_sp.AAC.1
MEQVVSANVCAIQSPGNVLAIIASSSPRPRRSVEGGPADEVCADAVCRMGPERVPLYLLL